MHYSSPAIIKTAVITAFLEIAIIKTAVITAFLKIAIIKTAVITAFLEIAIITAFLKTAIITAFLKIAVIKTATIPRFAENNNQQCKHGASQQCRLCFAATDIKVVVLHVGVTDSNFFR